MTMIVHQLKHASISIAKMPVKMLVVLKLNAKQLIMVPFVPAQTVMLEMHLQPVGLKEILNLAFKTLE